MTYAASLPDVGTFEAWRLAARSAISHGVRPDEIDWSGGGTLFGSQPLPTGEKGTSFAVPKLFLKIAGNVIWHSAPERFDLLYQALWRLHSRDGEPLSQVDRLGRKLNLMAKAVSRDIHKMHAFVRFRELPSAGQRRSFAAWFEPEHDSLEPASPFFAKRFAGMDWMIATPRRTARFEDGSLSLSEGMPRPSLPDDASEALWGTYFANIFNPARIKLDAMKSEMPKKYWANLPETRLIPAMLADAEARVERMREAGASVARPGAQQISTRYRAAMPQPIELPQTLGEARGAALQCRRCNLCEAATQTVWGDGDPRAEIMIVGEQPGDLEDLEGRPFVGPAGQLLRSTLAEIGADADRLYLTNAVKHFKFTPRGKRRLHKTASRAEVQHCRWWLKMEIGMVQPRIIMALGATAAGALTGIDSAMAARRGGLETGLDGTSILPTWHPAYILRAQDPHQKTAALNQFKSDLRAGLELAHVR